MSLSNSTLVNTTRQEDALTENGALTNSTTLNSVLDLFFLAGASRSLTKTEIKRLVVAALAESAEDTLKVIFWAGDIRGGAGERRFFKIALETVKEELPETFINNIKNVAEFNRFDSLFQFDNDENVLNYIERTLIKEKNGLLAKWLPREGKKTNSKFFTSFLKHTGLSKKKYRKLVAGLSKTVETNLSSKDYTFNYSHVPSVAFSKYRKAFARNDQDRFTNFITKVNEGTEKINAGAIFPYDIYKSFNRGGDAESVNAQWGSLPNYMQDSDERILPVCDVSGSMMGLPMEISVSLGVYISERNKSIFKDAFITFSERPQMNYLQGTTAQRFKQLRRADWGYNTDLQAVFRLILMNATKHKISQDEMPTKLLIISDMEFDTATRRSDTNYTAIKKKYKEYGYEMPEIIFWNVNGRSTNNFPVSFNKEGVALVSGASPSILKSVLKGSVSPTKVLRDTIDNPRYDIVKL